jgi:hypothetical protein
MTLIKKRDVKEYFAARRLQGSRVHVVPATQPDATSITENEPVMVETPQVDFNKDFTADHSSSRKPHPPTVDSSAPTDTHGSASGGRVRK